ncbi:2752_t:CDS:2, partial [Cetraspora pellucida]
SFSDSLDKDFNDNHILHEITPVSNNSATLTVGQTFAKWCDVEQYVNAYAIKAEIVCRHARTPIKYHVKSVNLEHNYPIDAAAVVFDPGHHKLSNNENMYVRMLYNGGVLVPTIVNMLTEEYSRYVHNKDIYNTLSHRSCDYVKGLLQTAELLKGLNDNNKYMFTYSVNNNRLHCLFFTTHSAVVKFKQYSKVLLMDATYKTNRFGMPLLLISGIDAMDITFLIASRLLTNETIPSCCWIFQQLKQLIGDTTFYSIQTLLTDREHALISAVRTEALHIKHQLCIWHVEQNIIRNLNHKLKERFILFIKDFKVVMFEFIENQFKVLWNHLLAEYPEANSYMTDQQKPLAQITQFSLPCHHVLFVHIVNKKVISVGYIGAHWIVSLAKLNTDMSQSEENNFTEFTTSSSSTDFSNKHSNNFLTTINYGTHNMSVKQTSTRSTVELLKDIEAIADRVGHIKINNILASFVEQLNTEYPLLQEDIKDPVLVKTKGRPNSTKHKKTDAEHATKKMYMCSIVAAQDIILGVVHASN